MGTEIVWLLMYVHYRPIDARENIKLKSLNLDFAAFWHMFLFKEEFYIPD